MAILKPDKTTVLGGVTINEYLLTKHNPNHIDMPSSSMEGKIIGVTIHNTSWITTASGTTPAEQYTRATVNGNMNDVRVHYYVDNTCAWQNLPLSLSGWHAADGSGNGNRRTISIECIMNSAYNDRDKKSEDNCARLAASLLKKYNLSIDHGLPEIVPEEAEIVRLIYRSFMNGMTPYSIGKMLTAQEIPTPGGKTKWQSSTIESILTNEKYKGSALLQKQFTVDFLTKKRKLNEGEIPQYYIENSHEAIISPDEFELVQAEFLRRKSLGKQYNSKSIFAARIVCGDCGNFYGSKVWHSTSKYRRVAWRCNHKFNGACKCNTPHLYEDTIKAKFLDACNQLFENRDEILDNCRMMQSMLTDCTEIDEKQQSIIQEMEVVAELTRKYIMENSQTAQSQDEYNSHYNAFVERYEKLKIKSLALQKQKEGRLAKRDLIGVFILELSKCKELLTEFNEPLWITAVDKVTVFHDGILLFAFKDGTEMEI